MNFTKLSLLATICTIMSFHSYAQRVFEYNASLSAYAATEDNLPMWAQANKFGTVPNCSNLLVEAGFFSDFNPQHKIQIAYGYNMVGALTSLRGNNNAIIDQLYTSAKWKFIRIDAGMVRPDIEYNGISSTNGNMLYSTNSRNMPGINLRTDYFFLPYLDRFIQIKVNLAEYRMVDDRYIQNTRLHNKGFAVKLKPWKRLELIAGVDHYAQWGGDSPTDGKQPSTFKDYLKIFAGQEGDIHSSLSSQLNVLGNHIGREHMKINYLADKFILSAYHDIPAEDRSGIKFRTVPDGLYGLYFGKNEKKGWVTDLIYEFYYTKFQAGAIHDRPLDMNNPDDVKELEEQDPNDYYYGRHIEGGADNYFNHGEYKSGWTLYGNSISSPFFTPIIKNADKSITLNNRFVAHYIGMKGIAFDKVPYQLRVSYSMNYGTYSQPLSGDHKQVSFSIEGGIPPIKNFPFNINCGVYGDFGKLYSNNVGLSVKISRRAVLATRKR